MQIVSHGDAFDENIEYIDNADSDRVLDNPETVERRDIIQVEQLLYTEIPQHFVFQKGEWKLGKQRR